MDFVCFVSIPIRIFTLQQLPMVIILSAPFIVYFSYKIYSQINLIKECFNGVMLEVFLEDYTDWFMSGAIGSPSCSYAKYSYRINDKSYEVTEKISKTARDILARKYNQYDNIKIMVSTKNNKNSCIYDIYSNKA